MLPGITRVAHAQEPASTQSQPISVENASGGNDGATIENGIIEERSFIRLFVSRRKEHLKAVKNIREMPSYEKKYKMVSIIAENALNVIETSRVSISGAKFEPGDGASLRNSTVRDALSSVMENCALFGDVVLQLPEITHRVIKNQKVWNATIHWSLNFVNETRHLLDEPTIAMFDLVRQELKITPRDPLYTNPYWSRSDMKTKTDKDNRKQKIAKDFKRNKGPRLVNIEL